MYTEELHKIRKLIVIFNDSILMHNIYVILFIFNVYDDIEHTAESTVFTSKIIITVSNTWQQLQFFQQAGLERHVSNQFIVWQMTFSHALNKSLSSVCVGL
jgi:hypothetical protein